MHPKCIILDREFLFWAQAWCTHDGLLCTQFMLKPFILDMSSQPYEKQFKHCKLNQALLGSCNLSHDYMHHASHISDGPSPPYPSSDVKHHQSNSLPSSPQCQPYPKTPHPSVLCVVSKVTEPLFALPKNPALPKAPSLSSGSITGSRPWMESTCAYSSMSGSPVLSIRQNVMKPTHALSAETHLMVCGTAP